jgi:hypothetical protein
VSGSLRPGQGEFRNFDRHFFGKHEEADPLACGEWIVAGPGNLPEAKKDAPIHHRFAADSQRPMNPMDAPAPASSQPKSRHRWFRFSLRAMLLMVTLLCMWLGVTANRANQQRRAAERIKAAGGDVGYDYEIDENHNWRHDDPSAPSPKWLSDIIGVDYSATVVDVHLHDLDDDSLAALVSLPHLRSLVIFDGPNVTDARLERLQELPRLERLQPWMCDRLTDAGLQHLAGLKHLSHLIVSGAKITPAGLRELQKAMPNLIIQGFWGPNHSPMPF